jgi:hypothetical protein
MSHVENLETVPVVHSNSQMLLSYLFAFPILLEGHESIT